MKKLFVIFWLVLLFSAIGALFWYNELIYRLPTPVPANYKPIANGTFIKLNAVAKTENGKPVLLHFFNPDCPCSRFNMATFKSLVKQYGNRVNFAIVVISRKNFTEAQIQEKFDIAIPILFNASLATACGVYSTPQAVVLNANHQLFYRGNYNRTRYCTDEKTNFAKMALTDVLNKHKNTVINQLALQAYGCSLPNCGLQ